MGLLIWSNLLPEKICLQEGALWRAAFEPSCQRCKYFRHTLLSSVGLTPNKTFSETRKNLSQWSKGARAARENTMYCNNKVPGQKAWWYISCVNFQDGTLHLRIWNSILKSLKPSELLGLFWWLARNLYLWCLLLTGLSCIAQKVHFGNNQTESFLLYPFCIALSALSFCNCSAPLLPSPLHSFLPIANTQPLHPHSWTFRQFRSVPFLLLVHGYFDSMPTLRVDSTQTRPVRRQTLR